MAGLAVDVAVIVVIPGDAPIIQLLPDVLAIALLPELQVTVCNAPAGDCG